MDTRTFKADALLLLTATIWGFAFVAQRVGMEYVGPFTFNGIRFALGSLSLLPVLLIGAAKRDTPPATVRTSFKPMLIGGASAGMVLFAGASLQQIGIVYTTAGKAGFITGLYVVLVPILGLFWRQRPPVCTWVGALSAAIGLYLLSVTEQFRLAFGDFLVLLGAFFWAGHVLIIGWLSPRMSPFKLAFSQFTVCSLLSLLAAIFLEEIAVSGLLKASLPLLYGGVVSVGVAYTLQVVAQRDARPAHAGILLSMETVFAALGGYVFLGETLSTRALVGCSLMLSGMLISQLSIYFDRISTLFRKRTKYAHHR